MLKEFIFTFLWSISPFGEAKVGIPYGLVNNLNPYLVFIVALAANILAFPLVFYFLNRFNGTFLKWHWYKKIALWVAKRTKKGALQTIHKFGYVGLLIFVMLPVPGTGVYAGTIATFLFKLDRHKSFFAIAVGITLSSIIVWSVSYLGVSIF